MFSRIVWPALGAGCAAGLVLAFMQIFLLTPIILHAENYEHAAPHAGTHAPAPVAAVWRASHELPLIQVHGPAGDNAGWAPEDGLERTLFTTLTTLLAAIGFALMLGAAMTLAGGGLTPALGLAWGAAGFVAIALAPALGLPPELPGSAAAGLLDRQVWWFGTVAATAAGLAAVFYGGSRLWIAAGIALIVLPHVLGAPHPHSFTSRVPAELQGQFVATSLAAAGAFWAVLGSTLGWLRQRQAG